MTLRTVLITGFETAPELAEVTSLTAHQSQARIYLLAGKSFGDRRGVARYLFLGAVPPGTACGTRHPAE